MPNDDAPASNPIHSDADLVGLCQTTARRVELAYKEATAGREAAEEGRDLTKKLVKSMQNIAADHAWMRHGVPASWPGRFVIAALGGVGATIFSTIVSACAANHGR